MYIDHMTADLFLSTPSARRATGRRTFRCRHQQYFYPRPPRGGRQKLLHRAVKAIEFLSTPSARRATSVWYFPSTFLCNFYPRPPRGGRHPPHRHRLAAPRISIHALREEGDDFSRADVVAADISIHALREEGDWVTPEELKEYTISIHALREEGDGHGRQLLRPGGISIHALREEGDPMLFRILSVAMIFLSTPSARRATGCLQGQERL